MFIFSCLFVAEYLKYSLCVEAGFQRPVSFSQLGLVRFTPPASWRYYEQWLAAVITVINHHLPKHIRTVCIIKPPAKVKFMKVVTIFSIQMTRLIAPPHKKPLRRARPRVRVQARLGGCVWPPARERSFTCTVINPCCWELIGVIWPCIMAPTSPG